MGEQGFEGCKYSLTQTESGYQDFLFCKKGKFDELFNKIFYDIIIRNANLITWM